jgi:hypothetical protein
VEVVAAMVRLVTAEVVEALAALERQRVCLFRRVQQLQ